MKIHLSVIFLLAMQSAVFADPCVQETIATSQIQNNEIWVGTLETPNRDFRFVITVAQNKKKESHATLLSLDEGEAQFQLDDFQIKDRDVTFEIKRTKAKFQGRLNEALNELEGKWVQNGLTLDLKFNKADSMPKDTAVEVWAGTLAVGFQKLKIQFRAYETADKSLNVYMDSLSQKVGGFKAQRKTEGDKVFFQIPALQASFEGVASADGQSIVGNWKQGPVEVELTMTRLNEALTAKAIAAKRPQNPTEPFPYTIEEVKFQNAVDKFDLAGTLTKPKGDGPFPAAILISGSGPQDRDETLLEHKPFWVLADFLSRNGVAVLRYDDRGVGKSGGEFEGMTSLNFATDTESALTFLKSRADINRKQIGLIGHSEGGLIAPIVAAKTLDVAWIVLLAGPGVNGKEILFSQGRLIVAAEGGTEADQNKQAIVQRETIEAMNSSKMEKIDSAAKEKIIEDLTQKIIDAKIDDKLGDPANRKALTQNIRANFEQMTSPWFRFFSAHEPGAVLERVRCPVLAVNGEKDVQVDPKLNLPKIEAALKAGGNQEFVIKEFPGLNHLFQTCKTGGLSEYATIEETFSPSALAFINDWIQVQINKKPD